ncbi:MAG: TraR/DksA family transcriptional regulator [Candidatus Tectomicrobia bacterium]|nr:TraR/DksA family transcriptional regulator [Candidatus Tectomicrobia bacterium]
MKKKPQPNYATVKTKLKEMKRALLARLGHTKGTEGFSSDSGPGDYLDEASRTQNIELNYVLNDRDRQELRSIEGALERIEAGSYGECEDCGGPIEPRRLEILPFAVLCVACQEEREVQQRRS